MKRVEPSEHAVPHNFHKPFEWDYPTQNTRFARTLEEAFGPCVYLHVERRLVTQTGIYYTLALLLILTTLYLLLFF